MHPRPRPARGPQRRRHREEPGPPSRCPVGGRQPATAVLAALPAGPAGAAVAVIAARAGISTAAARQALLACEKNGTATRVRGGRPGIADTWAPATPEASPAEAPGARHPAPAPVGSTAGDQQAEAGTGLRPDPAVTVEAAGIVLAIAQAAGEAGQALATGDLGAALAALEAARDLVGQGRRVIKAAVSGRRAPTARPGALRDLVEEHLRKFPEAAFTPHQVGKVLARSAGAVANALDKLVSLGTAEMVTGKPRSFRLAPAAPAPAADAAGGPAASPGTVASAA